MLFKNVPICWLGIIAVPSWWAVGRLDTTAGKWAHLFWLRNWLARPVQDIPTIIVRPRSYLLLIPAICEI